MSLVQVSRKRVEISRVPFGERPVLDLHLEENQRIVQVEEMVIDLARRKTVDWIFHVWIETRL